MMKKIKVVLLLIIMWIIEATSLVAQMQMDRFLVSSAGNSVVLSSAQLDYSLGEFMIGFYETENIVLQGGFHQGLNDKFSTSNLDLDPVNTSIQVFPNPTSGLVKITSPDDDLIHLSIRDQVGHFMRHIEVNRGSKSISIDMNNLTPGIYFISIITSKLSSNTTIKLIKQ